MLEFNNWFFVLLVNFLVTLFILNIILFRPLLRIFKEREDNVDGALRQARNMEEQKEKAMAEINSAFAQASIDARARFEELKNEGRDRQREALDEAGGKAGEHLEQARAELRAEAEKARQALREDVEKFSEEIVGKLVGV